MRELVTTSMLGKIEMAVKKVLIQYVFFLRNENCHLGIYGQLKMVTRWILF